MSLSAEARVNTYRKSMCLTTDINGSEAHQFWPLYVAFLRSDIADCPGSKREAKANPLIQIDMWSGSRSAPIASDAAIQAAHGEIGRAHV